MKPEKPTESAYLRTFKKILQFFDKFYFRSKGFLGWAHGMFLMGITGSVMAIVGFGSLAFILYLCGASFSWAKCAHSKDLKDISSCSFLRNNDMPIASPAKDQKGFDIAFDCRTDQSKTVCTASEYENKGFRFSMTERKVGGGKPVHDLFIQKIPENGAVLTRMRENGAGEMVFMIKGKKRNKFSVLCLMNSSIQNRSCELSQNDMKESI